MTRIVALVLAAAFVAIGTLGAAGSWVVHRMDGAIARTGERAEGHVTRKSYLHAADGDSDYTIDYWFAPPGGARIAVTRGIRRELWSSLREGDLLVVRYSAANPKRNFPESDGPPSLRVTASISLLFATLAAFGALAFVGIFRQRDDGLASAPPS